MADFGHGAGMTGARGDALAAKLAELVARMDLSPVVWQHAEEAPAEVLCDLLAWVAEQGAAGAVAVPRVCDEARCNCPVRPCRHSPDAPMPATRGNNPVNARPGAAPTTGPRGPNRLTGRRVRRARSPAPSSCTRCADWRRWLSGARLCRSRGRNGTRLSGVSSWRR